MDHETSREDATARTGNRSVDRACQVLSAFTLDKPALTLAALARRAQLPKATVHRLASTLVARGFLAHGTDGSYRLGVKLFELGAVVGQNLDAVQLCGPAIDALASATGETVLLVTADWSTREVLLVLRRHSPHPLAVGSPVGLRQPIPPGGAFGKALLSGLSPGEAEDVIKQLPLVATTPHTPIEARLLLRDLAQARELGYAAEQDEYIEGVSGVAVPVIFEGGRPLAALGVVAPTLRLSGELDKVGALLLDVTASLRPTTVRDRLRSRG